AIGSFNDNRFGLLDQNNKIIDNDSYYPFEYKEIEGNSKGVVFQSFLETNNKLNRFVVSTISSDVFEIYQITDNKVDRVFLSEFNHLPEIWEKGNRYTINYDKSIAGLTHISTTDEKIFFSYSSKTYEEFSRSGYLVNEILCFDWNGKKLKKYKLPLPISTFCVDEQYLYGVGYRDDNIEIYKYKL
ncbi:MAG: hypothetical protein IMY73_02185, partial [Bacteroidetes bacterium]|nr:hypothetical protein [Bacteroidota bacterium]